MRTIQTELVEKGYTKPNGKKHNIPRKKTKEKLTDRDWKELMGCNKDRFVRGKGGAFRRR
ncbi:hypothetical protein [Psychrobacillus sp. NPDC093180]|uniref:hypothetical protein n=1 Tax=Psychrobacillus sp. NPDC093180 TaxID=3364489 RepID=UPI003808FCCD